MAQRAPRFKTTRSSDECEGFAAAAGAGINMQTRPGRMPYGPQRTRVIAGAVAGSGVFTLEDDTTLTVAVQPGQSFPVTTPIKAIVTNANCSLVCEWWVAPGPGDWAHLPLPRNPP
jgi:hypothetical protein